MANITTRATNGAPLTHAQMDANFTSLDAAVDAATLALGGKSDRGAVTASGVTMAAARILGRTTPGVGAPEEIAVGAGLTLSGGTLSATGGGAVTSVAGRTGAVTLTVADVAGALDGEGIEDRIAALLQAGSGITLTYNDVANTLTIGATGGGGGGLTEAGVRALTALFADVTAGRAIAATDHGVTLRYNSASPGTFTLPTGLPAGTVVALHQGGAGRASFAAGSGATLVSSPASQFATAGQWATITATAHSATQWVISGEKAA